ncbi:two-component system response regulator [Brevundimonas sp. SORGH_AS_0993]|uniref:response regulator n=1 Tax=Brevundimonas sp. SORGH_AS_0993 TaxID=3041794 RepID=UPI0027821FE4|nr:response regulator [Brevundimonas sp. SORGH_AS_0993]MDQ1155415.1 CheY-like chemotaxis protein [Brevundimonas sp. SORGH_AS_0993]
MFAVNTKTLSRIEPVVRRAIIIDPNPAAVRLLADVMKGLGAREIYSETDDERALELARDVEPGIIFVERSGPTLNGETLTRRIRRSNMVCRTSPIIMVTTEATAGAIKGARDAGVHEFLRKPFTTGDLFKRVENVAVKPRPWIEAVNYVGPDRRRFNSGEYAGTRKRRSDTAADSNESVRNQAVRILTSAMAQFDQDPTQATRAIRQQASTLKTVAASMADSTLAIAAGGLEAYINAGQVTRAGLAQPIGAILALAEPQMATIAQAS